STGLLRVLSRSPPPDRAGGGPTRGTTRRGPLGKGRAGQPGSGCCRPRGADTTRAFLSTARRIAPSARRGSASRSGGRGGVEWIRRERRSRDRRAGTRWGRGGPRAPVCKTRGGGASAVLDEQPVPARALRRSRRRRCRGRRRRAARDLEAGDPLPRDPGGRGGPMTLSPLEPRVFVGVRGPSHVAGSLRPPG